MQTGSRVIFTFQHFFVYKAQNISIDKIFADDTDFYVVGLLYLF